MSSPLAGHIPLIVEVVDPNEPDQAVQIFFSGDASDPELCKSMTAPRLAVLLLSQLVSSLPTANLDAYDHLIGSSFRDAAELFQRTYIENLEDVPLVLTVDVVRLGPTSMLPVLVHAHRDLSIEQ